MNRYFVSILVEAYEVAKENNKLLLNLLESIQNMMKLCTVLDLQIDGMPIAYVFE